MRKLRQRQAQEMVRQRHRHALTHVERAVESLAERAKEEKKATMEDALAQITSQTREFSVMLQEFHRSSAPPRGSLGDVVHKRLVDNAPRDKPQSRNNQNPEPRDGPQSLQKKTIGLKSDVPMNSESHENRPKEKRTTKVTKSDDEKQPKAPREMIPESTETPPEDDHDETLELSREPFLAEDIDWTEEEQALFNDSLYDLSDDEKDEVAEAVHEDQKMKDRQRWKASVSNRGAFRQPRWRLEEAARNDIGEDELDDDDEIRINENMVLTPIEVFRSAVYTLVFLNRLERLRKAKYLDIRESEERDLDRMLMVYFDSTLVWIAKSVKQPIASVLNNPKLNFDLLLSKPGFGKIFQFNLKQRTDTAMMKLKVRVKGIVDGLFRATAKNAFPAPILSFFKKITTDDAFFPAYFLFEDEHEHLEFNEFGATRNMPLDMNMTLSDDERLVAENQDSFRSAKVLAGPRARVRMVLGHFIMTKILIGHVLVEPWQYKIGPAPKQKVVEDNLKIIRTLFFIILRMDYPLPQAGEVSDMIQEEPNNPSPNEETCTTDEETTDRSNSTSGLMSFFKSKSKKKSDIHPTEDTRVEKDEDEDEEKDEEKDEAPEGEKEEQEEEALEVKEQEEQDGEKDPDEKEEQKIFFTSAHISSLLYKDSKLKVHRETLAPFLLEQSQRLREWMEIVIEMVYPEERSSENNDSDSETGTPPETIAPSEIAPEDDDDSDSVVVLSPQEPLESRGE